MLERLREASALQDEISTRRRVDLVGSEIEVMIDAPGAARSHREAPEIDGVVKVPSDLKVGTFHTVTVEQAIGPDLVASAVRDVGDLAAVAAGARPA